MRQHSHVIGDFTWTGWDYLGEVGLGRQQYATPPTHVAPYPYLLASCGDLDITGHRRPVSYYREIVFGLRQHPYLAVQRPEHHGKPTAGSPWAWSDTIASWTWPGLESAPITVEVYSDADEVELLLNDRSLGRQRTDRFRAHFDTVYQPGQLVAIAYTNGVESGRTQLQSATGSVRLHVEADHPTTEDLVFVTFTLRDEAGILHPATDRTATIEVTGDGVLLGFGSANPSTEERFDATERSTYEGRALAVIRPTGPGPIRVIASATNCAPVEITIEVEEGTDRHR